jgi:hypothetical protein
MKDKLYNLINTETNKVISRNHTLNKREVDTFNFAFGVNGAKKKYEQVKKSPSISSPESTHPSGLSGEHDVVLDAIQAECLGA